MKRHNSYDALFERYNNRYAVTIAVAKRARQIHDGDEPLVDTSSTKSVTQALDEFMAECMSYEILKAEDSTESNVRKNR